MRLRQLARKLEVNPTKILSLLEDSGHTLANEANGKLTAEQVVIVESHFAQTYEFDDPIETTPETEAIVEQIEEAEEQTEEITELEVPLGPPTDVTSQVSQELIEVTEPGQEENAPKARLFKAIEDEEDDPDVELIKAPKLKLEGLKVVGKIDLPEPKPKKEEVQEEDESDTEKPRHDSRRNRNRKDRGRNRRRKPHGNPIEQERKRQERIAAKRKKEKEAAIKERKKRHYQQQLESRPASKKPKKKEELHEEVQTSAPVIYQTQTTEEKAPKVKQQGALRRFWGWLNGEYDKF